MHVFIFVCFLLRTFVFVKHEVVYFWGVGWVGGDDNSMHYWGRYSKQYELRITHYCSGRPTPSGGCYVVGQGEGPLAERIMGLFVLKFMC